MKKTTLCFTLFFCSLIPSYGQIKYVRKLEAGFLTYLTNTITVDADVGWKGYHLDENQNGIDLNIINSIRFKNDISLGIGLGYLNFEGIHGYSIFVDYEYYNSKKKIAPLTNYKIGLNHIFNQYEGGTIGVPVEIGFGVICKLNEKFRISAQSGFLFTQQSFLIPLRVGLRF
jgi:hypothetical protein